MQLRGLVQTLKRLFEVRWKSHTKNYTRDLKKNFVMWLQELVDSDSFIFCKTATSDRWGNATLNYELNLKTIEFAIYKIWSLVNCMFMFLKCENIRSLFLKHIVLTVSFFLWLISILIWIEFLQISCITTVGYDSKSCYSYICLCVEVCAWFYSVPVSVS